MLKNVKCLNIKYYITVFPEQYFPKIFLNKYIGKVFKKPQTKRDLTSDGMQHYVATIFVLI